MTIFESPVLGFGGRSSRSFLEPAEPEVEADLWYLGLAIMIFSACVMIGGTLWFLRFILTVLT